MKARILNNEFQGIYTDDFIANNLENVINGQLVSEWQLTEELPNENLLNPLWNGSEWIECATPEEIAEIQNSKIALQEMYPELVGMNYQLLQLDNLPNIERLEPMSDKGLKGIKNYVKDGVLIWSIESKFWFEADAEFSEGVIKTARIYDLGGRVVDSWVKRVRLSEDDKEHIKKVQRERILTYFKSQQSTLYNFLHIFFKDEIQDYISTGDKVKFETILLDAKDNHPFKDENGNYIVRLTLNSEVTTQSCGTTTVINGILNELV